MAKEKNGTTIAIGRLILTAIVIGVGLVAYAVTNTHKTGDTAENLTKLEDKGCDPARTNTTAVAVIQSEMATATKERADIRTDIKDFRAEQSAGKTEILKAIQDQKVVHEAP